MNKVKIIVEVSDEQIEDLMADAGPGLSYWVDHVNINYTRHQDEKEGLNFETALTNNAFLRIYDGLGGKSYSLTKKKLLKAIGDSITAGDFGFEDYDMYDAERVIQRALFGEVIYA